LKKNAKKGENSQKNHYGSHPLSYLLVWEEKFVAPLIATPNVDKCK
jgi:hypothetical protein